MLSLQLPQLFRGQQHNWFFFTLSEPLLNLFKRVKPTPADSFARSIKGVPAFLAVQNIRPKRITSALQRSMLIYTAAALGPKNAIVVFFFYQTQTVCTVYVYPTAIALYKLCTAETGGLLQLVKIVV
jgi:hypothetical protein